MYVFETPAGRAGWNQLFGMIESLHAELEQMFWQDAKHNGVSFGVGRTVHVDSTADSKVRLDAQIRECQAETTLHDGVEPYAWLKATLKAIAAGHPNSRIDEPLP